MTTPFSEAWKTWRDSDDGQACAYGTTSGVYLNNRLFHAFSAGWIAAMEQALRDAKRIAEDQP